MEVTRAMAHGMSAPGLADGGGPAQAAPGDGGELFLVTIAYNDGDLLIEQALGVASSEERVPEGASETVTVSGQPAVLFHGYWERGQDGQVRWSDGSPLVLTFLQGGAGCPDSQPGRLPGG